MDKENPQYLPDNWDDWENVGYEGKLAPKGHRGWEDLPAPYKYYHVKLDPKDVEEEGPLFKAFTDWRTALPLTALLATPGYLYNIFVLDERVQLALITWSTLAILKVNVGPAIGKMFSEGAQEIRDEVYNVEKGYRDALAEAIHSHETVMGLEEDLRERHIAERALKHREAAATTRAVRVGEVAKMKAMLENMVQTSEAAGEDLEKAVDDNATASITTALASDAALQQASIEDAIAAIENNDTNLFASTVATRYIAEIEKEIAAAEAGGEDKEKEAMRRDIFAKKFGFSDVVTADMMRQANDDPKVYAVLKAKLGGAEPAEGARISQKMPIDY